MEAADLTSSRFKANPYRFYSRLRAETPVYRTKWIFGLPVWVVTRYGDVLTVLKDERFSKSYVSRIPFVPRAIRVLTRSLLNVDPPDHTRLRLLVGKAFTPRVVEKLRDRAQTLCDELLQAVAAERQMDLVRAYALPVPLTIIAELLGIPDRERRQFASWSKTLAAGDSGRVIDALRGWMSMWRFGGYFRKLVAIRRADPQDDFVTALVQAEEAGDKLDEEELIAMLGLLLIGGYETTVNLIASGALTLMENPQQRELLQKHDRLAEPAVEELLRYTSPVDFATPRIAREDIILSGIRIPKGAFVLPALISANRDEAQFANADILDITRDPNRHVAFGMGAHFCLGAPLARLEGQIALPTLFRRFPTLHLATDPKALRWRKGLLLRGLHELPVVW